MTACEGLISQRTLEKLRACPVDLLGSPGSGLGTKPAPTPARIPTLLDVLVLARDEGGRVNLEIKNVPGDADFDPGEAFANTVLDAVVASGFPTDRLIVQSFVAANLGVAGAGGWRRVGASAHPAECAFAAARAGPTASEPGRAIAFRT